MSDAEFWHSKSDEDLLDAADQLADYTEEGETLIRNELLVRGLPAPPPPIGRCQTCGRAVHASQRGSACAQCGVDLSDELLETLARLPAVVDEDEPAGDGDDAETPLLNAGDDVVRIATFPNLFEASLAKTALQASGIPAFIPDESVMRYQKQFADVFVLRSDQERAIELLREAGHS